MMDFSKFNTEQKVVLNLYAFFGFSLLLSFIPHLIAAFLSLFAILATLIAAYIVKYKSQKNQFIVSHSKYIIRMIWAGSGIAVLTIAIAGSYMYFSLDNTPLQPCLNEIANPYILMSISSLDELRSIFAACYTNYIKVNLHVFLIAGVVCIIPTILYFGVLFIKGVRLAIGNLTVPYDEKLSLREKI